MNKSFISMAYGEKFANDIELFNAEVKKITDKNQDFFDDNPDLSNRVYHIQLESGMLTITEEIPDYMKEEIKEVWLAIFG